MTDTHTDHSHDEPDRLEKARLEKLHRIEQLGHDPWGHRFDGHTHIAAAREKAPAESGVDGESVRVGGRIMRWNDRGKLIFFHIQDYTGTIQIMASKGDLPEAQWELLQALDLGDIVGVDGALRRTRTGEISVFQRELTLLCKSLAQPPEKFHGAKDIEMLLRQRYIDLIYNEGVRDRMLRRTKIIQSIRRTLDEREFFEVETPVLHAVAGGAAARPFVTHHNALDIDLYLRIALELHLKRLMVGGVERVYELSRVFRNEGIDATHNPEFTMLELYQAYGNYETMMELAEAIISQACMAANGTAEVSWGDKSIDFTPPYRRAKYADLFREHAGCEIGDRDAVRAKALELIDAKVLPWELKEQIAKNAVHHDVLVSEVFEATVEEALTGPVFVIDYPASLCPLTKRKAGDPEVAERFELYVHGMEVANAYTELNDPRLQEDLFRTQLAGLPEEESMAKMDHDFVRALKVGMPAAGGMGIGIDRLVMLLTDSRSIRDVIFFPAMRPEGQ